MLFVSNYGLEGIKVMAKLPKYSVTFNCTCQARQKLPYKWALLLIISLGPHAWSAYALQHPITMWPWGLLNYECNFYPTAHSLSNLLQVKLTKMFPIREPKYKFMGVETKIQDYSSPFIKHTSDVRVSSKCWIPLAWSLWPLWLQWSLVGLDSIPALSDCFLATRVLGDSDTIRKLTIAELPGQKIRVESEKMLKQRNDVFLKIDALEWWKIKKSKKSMEIQKSNRAFKFKEKRL